MNAEHEQASAFLTHSSLAWSDEMGGRQLVDRDQVVAVLAEYRKATGADIAKAMRRSTPDYYFVRLTLFDGGRTAWARQTPSQNKPIAVRGSNDSRVVFELVDSTGVPRSNGRIRLKVGAYEVSPASLVNGKLRVEG